MPQYARMRGLRHLMLVLLALQFCAYAPHAESAQPSAASLTKTIDQALADPVLAHGIQGVLIESLKTGRVLYRKNADLNLTPASCLKLVVSATALDLLGPDFRYRTSLYISGRRTPDGILKGDLVLLGDGDPVFGHEDFRAMASRIKELGIKSVEGNIVGDDTMFDDVRLGWGWAWDDEPYYYSAQISALNLNENVVDVWVRPGRKAGDPAVVKVTPPTGYMVVRNNCATSVAGSEKALLVDRAHGRNTIRVTGTVPLDYKPENPEESIAVDDPALFACQTLAEMLRREGIEVSGDPVRGKKPDAAELVATHDSPPLAEMLVRLNKPSDNLIAECLLKTLGARIKGHGTADAGKQVELDFLGRIGADLTAVSLIDGSGLSRMNCISPGNLVTVLRHMYGHKHSRAFLESLPIAGVDGTLKRRMKGTPAEGNLRAKTGYVSRVSTISGYVTTKSGEPLVFSILMNSHLCRNKEATAVQDRIITALSESEIVFPSP